MVLLERLMSLSGIRKRLGAAQGTYCKGFVNFGGYGYFCYLWECDLVQLF